MQKEIHFSPDGYSMGNATKKKVSVSKWFNHFFYLGEIIRISSRKAPRKEHIINEDIPFHKVFVVNEKGEKLGIIESRKAIYLAKQDGKDLVIISSNTNPPVARIMDYGKFKYKRKKHLKGEKVKQTIINNREVRLTPLIGIHDLNTKARKAREFILRGDRVKISLKFKGRELARKDLGFETLKKFFALIEDIAKVDKEPKLNAHRFLDMYVTQDKKKINIIQGDQDAKNEIKKSTEQEN